MNPVIANIVVTGRAGVIEATSWSIDHGICTFTGRLLRKCGANYSLKRHGPERKWVLPASLLEIRGPVIREGVGS